MIISRRCVQYAERRIFHFDTFSLLDQIMTAVHIRKGLLRGTMLSFQLSAMEGRAARMGMGTISRPEKPMFTPMQGTAKHVLDRHLISDCHGWDEMSHGHSGLVCRWSMHRESILPSPIGMKTRVKPVIAGMDATSNHFMDFMISARTTVLPGNRPSTI